MADDEDPTRDGGPAEDEDEDAEPTGAQDAEASGPDADDEQRLPRTRRAWDRVATRAHRVDGSGLTLRAAEALRRRLPGDERYGDALSTAGNDPAQLLGQRLAAAGEERPSAARELGLGALQVWQSVAEAQGRGAGDRELAILFTDLVAFSGWALHAGDDAALELLRLTGQAIERPVVNGRGRVVKRLGDGLMAVFDDPSRAVRAAHEAHERIAEIEIDGYTPQMRAGLHVGRPRKLGGDYFGVDVNVAARVAAAAGPGEVLVSETVRDHLDDDSASLRRKLRFKAKGTPRDLRVWVATPARD